MSAPAGPTRADVCAVAIAECFRDDGEIVANPIGTLPMIGGRLAKATFAPQLLMTDGEALLVENVVPVGVERPEKVVGAWNPYRAMFDVVWSGRRHVMMGASQIDPWGNQNFAFIGSHERPRAQLLGMRGAPGNTINHRTSYWVPNHSPRVFVPSVDVVSGVGYDRAAALGDAARFHELVCVVTDLCVLDFRTPDHRMRLRSVHPGVSVDDVVAATGFELVIDADVPPTRLPEPEELDWLARIDPNGLRHREVPDP
ncbi:MAG: CoA-transferase [Acidimicrobiia bacterium]|nr:MAG: CoA-transferase [Acidimicrobiia bacterium]